MRLLIRADANTQIGTGHIMRCMALAQGWHARGSEVTFISDCESDSVSRRLREEGFQFIKLNEAYPDPGDWEVTSRILSSTPDAWVVVDGYHFDSQYQYKIKQKGARLLAIDDTAHLEKYNADLVLNQNISAENIRYPETSPDTHLLRGPRYALLRSEFLSWQEKRKIVSDHVRKILITLGGADQDNVSLTILKGLMLLNEPDMEVKIVIGPTNPHFNSIKKALKAATLKATVVPAVSDMTEVISCSDLAISAGGSTCYELAFMGIPFFVVILAENQRQNAIDFEKNNIAANLGWHKELSPTDVACMIENIMGDKKRRELFSANGRMLIDGYGLNRVLEVMQPTQINLNKAREVDCEFIWALRNDPIVRNASFSSDVISLETHRQWFTTMLNNPSCLLYIAKNQNDVPVGQIRFDTANTEAMISVSIDRPFRKVGLGSRLIKKASQRFLNEKKVERIYAFLKPANMVSVHAFKKGGYRKLCNEVYKGANAVKMIYTKEEMQ